MKRLLLTLFLFISVLSSFPIAVAQSPSFYGYGDDAEEYYYDRKDYINAGGRIPTLSPEQERARKKEKDEQFSKFSETFGYVFWIGLIIYAIHKGKEKNC